MNVSHIVRSLRGFRRVSIHHCIVGILGIVSSIRENMVGETQSKHLSDTKLVFSFSVLSDKRLPITRTRCYSVAFGGVAISTA